MKNIIKSVLFFTAISSCCLADSPTVFKETEPTIVVMNELSHLDHLIAITEKNLEKQKALRQLFLQYQQLQVRYLQNTQDKELTLEFVKAAYRLLEAIKNSHMLQLFDAEFISQLTFFSQFAMKCG